MASLDLNGVGVKVLYSTGIYSNTRNEKLSILFAFKDNLPDCTANIVPIERAADAPSPLDLVSSIEEATAPHDTLTLHFELDLPVTQDIYEVLKAIATGQSTLKPRMLQIDLEGEWANGLSPRDVDRKTPSQRVRPYQPAGYISGYRLIFTNLNS